MKEVTRVTMHTRHFFFNGHLVVAETRQMLQLFVPEQIAKSFFTHARWHRKVLVETANLVDDMARPKKNKRHENSTSKPSRSLAATLGFARRYTSPPPAAVTELKGTKTRRR